MSDATEHLGPFTVYELRRYTVTEGERGNFAAYFETFFPEAFQQLGALFLGQFFERATANRFTWLRGFRDLDQRAVVNAAFYYGPLWKEHRTSLNERLLDWKNVLLLRPLRPERAVTVMPAVDPVRESAGATGVVVMQVFAVRAGETERLAEESETVFAAYRAAGAREAGVLVTLDVPNNFPQHPVREDGPFLVWLGVLTGAPGDVARITELATEQGESLRASGLLREAPELVLLDPTPRSRLRWLDAPSAAQ
jgi:NIPSNAP protein